MRARRRAGAIATVLVALAAMSACTSTPAASPSSPSSTPALESSPTESASSPTPSPTSETEIAAANAEDLVHEYYRVIDELGADPDLELGRLEDVAVSKDLDSWKQQLARDRRDELRQTGVTRLAEVDVRSVSLDDSDPASGRVPTVQIDVCFDVSDVDILDEGGESVVTAERPDTGWIRHTVANYSWDDDPTGGWRVSTSVDLEQPPCARAD